MSTETKRQRPLKPSLRKEGDPKFTVVPPEWNNTYKNLVRKDFADDKYDVFLDWQADQLELKAKETRAKAQEFRISGGKSTQTKATKYRKLMASIAALEAELSESGVDLDALKASMAS